MVKEPELNPELIEKFKSAVFEYCKVFGVTDWDIGVTTHKSDTGDMANVTFIYAARAANVSVDTGYDADEDDITRSAMHEVLHLLLTDFREAYEHLVPEDDAVTKTRAAAAEHAVINRIINAFMEKGDVE